MENKKTNTLIHLSEPRYGEGHIFLWWENYCRRLLYADILYVEGSGSYSEFHAIDGSRVTISYRLGVMERSLPDDTFIRVHQSFILNWHYIDTFVGNSVKIGDRWFPIGGPIVPAYCKCYTSRNFPGKIVNRSYNYHL